MKRRNMFALCLTVLSGLACGSATAPDKPQPQIGPTSVAVVSGTRVKVHGINYTTDTITVHLHNSGGSGDFYLEFWGAVPPNYAYAVAGKSDVVNVLAGYDESLMYVVPFDVGGVRAQSRPVNTGVYAVSGCYTWNGTGTCP